MKLKQIVAVVLLSAGTTVGTLWGYNRIAGNNESYTYSHKGSDSGKVPVNYAGFYGLNENSAAVDFTAAAEAASPATTASRCDHRYAASVR